MTKSKRHHLPDGEPSTSNNTSQFFKYKLIWKDAIYKEHLQAFIDLMLFDAREFDYYPDSDTTAFINAWVIGKLKFSFVYGGNLNCIGAALEFYSNGE